MSRVRLVYHHGMDTGSSCALRGKFSQILLQIALTDTPLQLGVNLNHVSPRQHRGLVKNSQSLS